MNTKLVRGDPILPLPKTPDMEAAALGAVLVDPPQWDVVRRRLREEDFGDPFHRYVFSIMDRLSRSGVDLDPLIIAKGMAGTDCARLMKLMDGMPRSARADVYAGAVLECSRRRRIMEIGERLQQLASDGADPEALRRQRDLLEETISPLLPGGRSLHTAVKLYSVPPLLPEFTVERFIRRRGLHVIWSAPGVGKTFTVLRLVHELMTLDRRHLFDHPKLDINRRYRRVLWVGCEEDAGTLRAKADMVSRGLDCGTLLGDLMFLWAADPKSPITLLHLDKILEEQGPFDAVVMDTLTGLLPPEMGGEPVRWDADNAAVTRICLFLRGMAATRDVDLFLVHHTGRDTAKGYRGPVAWWGAADMLIGFTPDDGGGMTVLVEKCRDAGRVSPFILSPTWGPDGYRLAYEGAAPTKALSPTAAAVDAVLRERGHATQKELCEATGRNRSTVQPALSHLCRIGLARLTGIAQERSPEYEAVRQDEGRPQ